MSSSRSAGIPHGLHPYRGKGKFTGMALQLRVEPNGQGLLVINANTVLYLNETATAHAYFFIQGMETEEVVKKLRKIYKVKKDVARKDHERFLYTVSTLAQTEKVCPISYLDVDRVEPFSQETSAPIRMDLALTFRCQNDCVHCYTCGPRKSVELTTDEWKKIIDRLYELGIFIVDFTGGEPTLREDLPELLLHAQRRGVVTGLVTNGRRLKDKEYVDKLVAAGLDFAQITIESHDPLIHDSITKAEGSWKETVQAIKNVLETPIYLTTNTTLNKHNWKDFLQTIDFLHGLGVKVFGCNSLIYSGKASSIADEFAIDIETLTGLLPKIDEKASELDMKFLWYTPTQYCEMNPVNLGLGVKSCTAARINMCVGPDGSVYPCQSYFETLGNILKDSWNDIWNHPLAKSLRNREYAASKCRECPELSTCGGGCPLELRDERYLCAE